MRETVAFSGQMLDALYRIQDTRFKIHDALMMKSNNIWYPETRIQDQSILAMVFIATAKFEYSNLCNYRVDTAWSWFYKYGNCMRELITWTDIQHNHMIEGEHYAHSRRILG